MADTPAFSCFKNKSLNEAENTGMKMRSKARERVIYGK
jgi:hypothetical protein